MAEALRRLLWSIPLLGALTVALFFCLSHLHAAERQLSQPRFYNPDPDSAQHAAQQAVADLLQGRTRAAARLVELGGAALPTLLDSLPTRPLAERRRISDALWPIALRMGFSAEDIWVAGMGRVLGEFDIPTSDEKLIFWERFGKEHATDLAPLAVQRLVKRVATRDAQLRERELRAIDTFALPALVEALGRVKNEKDAQRCRRLIKYINHATGKDFSVNGEVTVDAMRREVTNIRTFWDEKGAQWTQYSPFQRLLGRVVQTEYVKWLTRTLRAITRLDRGSLSDQVSSGFVISAPLLSACLFGLFGLGPLISSAIQVILLSMGGYRIERFGLRLVLTSLLVVLTSWTLRLTEASRHEMFLLSLLSGAAFGTFVLQRELSDRLNWRTHHVLSRRRPIERVAAVVRWIAPAVPTLLPMALVEAAMWVICLESKVGRPGLGELTVRALRDGNTSFLMAMCLGLGLLTLSLQIFADLMLGDNAEARGER
jgi:hypothetical protein